MIFSVSDSGILAERNLSSPAGSQNILVTSPDVLLQSYRGIADQ